MMKLMGKFQSGASYQYAPAMSSAVPIASVASFHGRRHSLKS